MTVTIRRYKRGGWEADIMLTIPGRPGIRDRKKSPFPSKSASKRWGEERERQLIHHYTSTTPDDESRPDITTKEVPTLASFFPRYLKGHCEANRLRLPTIIGLRGFFRNHLLPAFGRKRLDRITAEDIQQFKAERSHLAVSTINIMLAHLRALLNVAVDWQVVAVVPTKIKLLKQPRPALQFYDFEEFDRLILAAERLGSANHLLTVLLGGEAGLRRGEIRGLKWEDIDMEREQICVARRVWRQDEAPPKSGNTRVVPVLPVLAEALAKHRHLRGPYVVLTGDNNRASDTTVTRWLSEVQREAALPSAGTHILRRTFCSHAAMKGVPVGTIQEWAGHADLKTTQRYMYLSPTGTRDAVALMKRAPNWRDVGNAHRKVINIK